MQAADDLVIAGAGSVRPPVGDSTAAGLQPQKWAAQPARLARMDRLCALALVAVDAALLDAQLSPSLPTWDGARTAIVFGTAFGCHGTNEEYYRSYLKDGLASASPRLFAYTLPSSPVGEISIHYGVTGPATALAQGLTAGLDAILDGARQLKHGRAGRSLIVAADVATPLLHRLLADDGHAGAIADSSAAVIVERAQPSNERRARLLGGAAVFIAGDHAAATTLAVENALANAGLAASAITTTLVCDETLLAAAPVHALTAWLADADATSGIALCVAADPAGAATAIVVQKR